MKAAADSSFFGGGTPSAVARVFPASETVEAALKTAAKMASFSLPHLMMCKEAVNQAYEVGLQQVLTYADVC